jgi:hypothetical protein
VKRSKVGVSFLGSSLHYGGPHTAVGHFHPTQFSDSPTAGSISATSEPANKKFPTSRTFHHFKTPEKMCGTDGTNSTNGTSAANVCSGNSALLIEKPRVLISGLQGALHRSNPYQPVGDFLSNVGRFKIIESTLRGQIPTPSPLGSYC